MANGAVTEITLPPGYACPSRINDAGEMIGYTNPPPPSSYLMCPQTSTTGLCAGHSGGIVAIEFPGAEVTHAQDINNKNQVVGAFRYNSPDDYHGFIWSPDGFSIVDVPGSQQTSISAINDKGEIVAKAFDSWFLGTPSYSLKLDLPPNKKSIPPTLVFPHGKKPSTWQRSWLKVQATLLDSNGKPVPGQKIDFKWVVPPDETILTGHCQSRSTNHDLHALEQTIQTLSASCTKKTGKTGTCTAELEVPRVAGRYSVEAFMDSHKEVSDSKPMMVRIEDLVPLVPLGQEQQRNPCLPDGGGGTGYVLVGEYDTTPAGSVKVTSDHYQNHFATAALNKKIVSLAGQYSAATDQVLQVNDMSLAGGGIFDIYNDWGGPDGKSSHVLHLRGHSVDINKAAADKQPLCRPLLDWMAGTLGLCPADEGPIHYDADIRCKRIKKKPKACTATQNLKAVRVTGDVTPAPDGLLRYEYAIQSDITNSGRIDSMAIDISGRHAPPKGPRIPNGRGFMADLARSVRESTDATPSLEVGLQAPPEWLTSIAADGTASWKSNGSRGSIPSGAFESGFVISSRELPGIRKAVVEAAYDFDALRVRPPSGYDDLERYEKDLDCALAPYRFNTVTIGPTDPPAHFDAAQFAGRIHGYVRVARAEGWISSDEVANTVSNELETAIEALKAGKPDAAKKSLRAILSEVDRDSGVTMQPEAVALLRLNTEFLLGNLP